MTWLWSTIRWLHVLAMAFFVGGQIMFAVVVVPVERRAPDRDRLRALARRFGYGTLVAITVLIATGSAMATHYALWGEPRLQAKLALVALVAVLLAWHVRRPTWHVLEAVVLLASLVIVWLGLAIASGPA
jgi:uncharacterized membrane protein